MIGAGTRREEPPIGGGEVVVLVIGLVVAGVAGVVWGGARLAAALAGGRVVGGVTEALGAAGRLVSTPGDPAAAWGDAAAGLPGPAIYWAATATVAAAAGALAACAVWVWRRWSRVERARVGVATEARLANGRDARPLVVKSSIPPTGRMLLGRLAPHGPLLATEDRERQPARGRRAALVQGDRGSVALLGPTRAGKSVLASGGIIAWDGSVVAVTVKDDLYAATAAARALRGELAVYDPGGVTGLPTARWTPLRDVTTTSGALRAGRALAAAIPRQGVTGGDFWAAHGETLTAAYMALAGLSQLLPAADGGPRKPLSIGRLASWAYRHIGITEPTVHELLRLGLNRSQPLEVQLLAKDAATKLMAFQGEDPRIRASIFATARLAFDSWNEPSVAHSASRDPRDHYWSDEIPDRTPRFIDLEWLMEGPPNQANTLYLTAPTTEFARLAPALGGLLGDIREQIHAWDVAGRKVPKPLLIVIDEAAQLQLRWLPEEVSTIAGLGGVIVTCWQSKAQISHAYGTLADAVLGGHRSKIFFAGIDDPSTSEYVAKVAGTEHVGQRGWSADTGGGRRTVSEHVQREDLLPAHVLRQMRRQEAVLLHGTLPPIHMAAVRWWEDRCLRSLVPHDADGRPMPPPATGTCPATPGRQGGPEPVLEASVLEEALNDLPKPRTQVPDPRLVPSRDPRGGPVGHPQLPLETPSPSENLAADREAVGRVNRVAGYCDRCGNRVPIGAGRTDEVAGRQVLRCDPACPTSSR